MFTRKCPRCENEITHKYEWAGLRAQREGRLCGSCAKRKRYEDPNERLKTSISTRGEKNPFWGKKHLQKSLERMSKSHSGSHASLETRRKMSEVHSGEKNSMFGTHFYDVWERKYNPDEVRRRRNATSRKKSLSQTGEKNPMFGKPSPVGTGRGWAGWYKGKHFRSLHELSYMVILEKNEVEWKCAECDELTIPYTDARGVRRTYRADFLIEGRRLVEIKPKRLVSLPENLLKRKAAMKFCKARKMEYRIVSPPEIPFLEVIQWRESGLIRFTQRVEILYQQKKEKLRWQQL